MTKRCLKTHYGVRLNTMKNVTTFRHPPHPSRLSRPLAPDGVKAGFPSPAQDYEEEALDINDYLVRNPTATFYVRVEGDSMDGAGIHHGDILVVDRSLTARHGHIVVAFVGSERLVKRLSLRGGKGMLVAANPRYPAIEINPEDPATIWGVVTGKFARIGV